ncbi:TetR/AcrR family transcriptional regulator [Sphingomonas sp. KC8]|uniref:TetR/AcrR family transcriptional regulator n=1 Tax=Sphingomonas sp. KC8 TaxID=1030157 RepID=UPI0002489F94|nr:TetR/AcrR family transcriptional regulator [Sphingomonas sp. KC8]ARS26126.1 hypothetical protein KC8_02320 [Sphingomonas sp. KC8]
MAKANTVSKRGRPTKEQVARINQAITTAAADLFLMEGYAATAMEAVAARAGISKVTLYNRFPAKADLFAAVVADRVDAWSAEASRHDAQLPSDPRGRLEYHALILLQSLAHPEIAAFGRLIAAEQRRFPELARIYRERALAFEVDLLVGEIETIARENGQPPRDARSVAFALMHSLWGWSSMHTMFDESCSAADQQEAVKRIVALFVEGRAAW